MADDVTNLIALLNEMGRFDLLDKWVIPYVRQRNIVNSTAPTSDLPMEMQSLSISKISPAKIQDGIDRHFDQLASEMSPKIIEIVKSMGQDFNEKTAVEKVHTLCFRDPEEAAREFLRVLKILQDYRRFLNALQEAQLQHCLFFFQ
jgi:hypothetical protein